MLLSALFISACNQQQEQAPQQHRQQPVVVLPAYAIALNSRLETQGTALANESVIITSKVTGTIEEINFSDGQSVKQGDVIARFDQDEEQALLDTAMIQLAEHQREIRRLNSLIKRHAAPQRTLDERKTLAAVTASTIKQIKARIDELTLRAPFDGKLGIRQVSPGALILPGTVITTLDQTDPIKLDFTVAATQLQHITIGTPLNARSSALDGLLFEGAITSMHSRIDPVTRTMLLRASLDNREQRLIPGMLMNIELHLFERQGMVVPEESITQKQDQHFITIIQADNKAEIRPVKIGQRYNGFVEVTDGLKLGELVVVRGMGFIKSGADVIISETWKTMQNAQFNEHNQNQ